MPTINEVSAYLNEILNLDAFRNDSSNNGLQFEGSRNVTKAVFGVDACAGLFMDAADADADFIFVHHGLSWGGSLKRITGVDAERIAVLAANNISLYAAHLPLDANPEFGHNIQMARLLGLEKIAPFGWYDGYRIGFAGQLRRMAKVEDVAELLNEKLPSEGVPYPLMVYAGMLMWQFFSSTVSSGSESLLGNSNLISKVYFPRLIIPSTSMTVSLTDFLISAVVFIPLFFWYGTIPSWKIVFLPCFILLTAILSLGVTYFISSLNVKYRDFRYVIPFALQVGMYISPVGFTTAIVPERWQLLYSLNPLVGIIDGVRWSLFGTPLNLFSLLISIAISLFFLLCGYFMFRRMEREFADFI